MATNKARFDKATIASNAAPSSIYTTSNIVDNNHKHPNDTQSRSMTIDLAATSASSSNDQLFQRQQQDQSIANQARRVVDNDNTNNNNNNNKVTNKTAKPPQLNYCHHQAATRSILLQQQYNNNNNNHHHHHRNQETSESLITTTTSASDNSDDSNNNIEHDSPTPPPHYHEIPGIVPAYQGRTSGPPPSYDDVVNPNAQPPSYHSLFGQVREARKRSNGLVDLLRQLFLILIGTLGCTMIIGFLLLIPITMILVGIVYVNECRAENIPSFLVIGGVVWIVKNILNCYNQFKKDSTISNRPPPRRTISSNRSASNNTSESPASVLIVANHITTINDNINDQTIISQLNESSSTTSTQGANEQTNAIPTTTTRRPDNRQQQQSANRIRTPSLIGITSFKCESMLNYFLIVWFLAGCVVVYRIYEPDYDNPLSSTYCNRTVYLYAFWLMTSAFIIMAIVLSCLCCLMASSLMSCNHGR